MKWLFLIGILVLCSRIGGAATDPLSNQFFPTIDTSTSDYPSYIKMTDDMYKVLQSSPLDSGWTNWLTLYGMQNEMVSFQVHVRPTLAISSLTITLSNLTNAQTGTVISSATTDVIGYREYFTPVSTISSRGAAYMQVQGNYPDALIPAIDPYYHQTTNAWPTSVSSNTTQSAWFDVHIPTSAPSGYYLGTVTVSSGSVVLSTMPVVVAAWAWIMPSTATLGMVGSGFGYNVMCDVSYGGTGNCGNYPGSGGGSDGANTMQWIDGTVQMLDNRYGIDYPSNIYPESGSFSSYVTNIGPLISGTQAHVKGILPGAALPIVAINNITFTSGEWQNYVTNFHSNGWDTNTPYYKPFYYLCDEPPSGCSWSTLIANSTTTRTFSTPVIPNLVTTDMADALTNGATNEIDWMTPIINNLAPTSGDLRYTYNTWLSTNVYGVTRRIGSYNDCESAGTCGDGTIGPSSTPAWPNRHIDGFPVANRAMEWMMFKDTVSYELYFSVDCNATSDCGGNVSVWQNAYQFGCNGDGSIVYPSSPTVVAVSTPIWVPTMRLKYYRDGEQDYEYMNKLANDGKSALVWTEINSWIISASSYTLTNSGLENARLAMGWAIHQETYPPATPIPAVTFKGAIRFKGREAITP